MLLDRLDGGIAELVERQATPSAEEAVAWMRAALDAYINQLYRMVKSDRDGHADVLDAWGDDVELIRAFAMSGKH